MDPNPNETLRRIREIVARVVAEQERDDDAAVLASYVESLDGWLANGGFLPDAWQR